MSGEEIFRDQRAEESGDQDADEKGAADIARQANNNNVPVDKSWYFDNQNGEPQYAQDVSGSMVGMNVHNYYPQNNNINGGFNIFT